MQAGPEIVVITLADRGCYYLSASGFSGKVGGFKVRTIDTTACGDAFLAGFLNQIVQSKKSIGDLTARDLRSACTFGNASGALASTRRGAVSSMPTLLQVRRLLKKGRK